MCLERLVQCSRIMSFLSSPDLNLKEESCKDAVIDVGVEVGRQRDSNPGENGGCGREESAGQEGGSGARDLSRDSRAESTVTAGSQNTSTGFEGLRNAKPSWVCSRCTFENEISTRKCSVCGEGVRPAGIGRSQPLTPRALGEENREPPSGNQGTSKKTKAGIFF